MLKDGSFFGTLCAIDPNPAHLKNTPDLWGCSVLFADLISLFTWMLQDKLALTESKTF
jgi:hypothetical protein